MPFPLLLFSVLCIIRGMNDADKIPAGAAKLDACIAELSPQAQNALAAYIEWICENVLTRGGGEKSAKELILQTERYKMIKTLEISE